MNKIRKIEMVINHVKLQDEDRLDVLFWLNKTPKERLAEVYRLRVNYFTQKNNSYPIKMEKVVNKKPIHV